MKNRNEWVEKNFLWLLVLLGGMVLLGLCEMWARSEILAWREAHARERGYILPTECPKATAPVFQIHAEPAPSVSSKAP